MFKACALLAVAFCALCIIPSIAAKDPTASADADAAFWNWKNDISNVRKFTYWHMPLALYPRCACHQRGA